MTSDQLTLFAEDFPAPIFPSLVRDSASPDPRAAYGRSTPELLARYDPATSSWRTSQLCLDGALSEFSETWPRSGLMRNGIAYQLPPLVRLTDATGSGSWPTPTANLYEVTDVPALLERREECKARQNNGNGFGLTLQQTVAVRMWPTPTQAMAKDCGPLGSKAWQHNFDRGRLDATAKAYGTKNAGSLNPAWVEWLMGFPLGWTALEASVMPSSRRSRKSSGGQS
jgi:hypothetical protein